MTDRITCEEAELFISASLDGELSPEEQASLDSHIASCPDCRRSLEEATALRQIVGASLRTPDESLTANVTAAVRADARFRRQSRLVRRVSAAAAALLVAAGLTVAGQSAVGRGLYESAPNASERTADIREPGAKTDGITAGDADEATSDDIDNETLHYGPETGKTIASGSTGTVSSVLPAKTLSLPWQFFAGLALAAAGIAWLAVLFARRKRAAA